MQSIIENWMYIAGGAILIIMLAGAGYQFLRQPREEQIKKVKAWMLLAVTEAERRLGSGTGKQKLQFVYDLAVQRFPWIEAVVSAETFSGWVDEALLELKQQLQENQRVAEYVSNYK